MDRISMDASERAPMVDFDFPNRRLVMRGESYPEDAASFFGPLVQALRAFLTGLGDGGDDIVFDLEMAYFNSSSAKALMNIFLMLEASAADGHPVRINWHYRDGDDIMQEFGEDFAEDFEHAQFDLCVMAE